MAGKAFGEMRKIDEAMKLKLPQSHDNEIMLPSGEVVAAKVGRGAARLSTQQQMDLQQKLYEQRAYSTMTNMRSGPGMWGAGGHSGGMYGGIHHGYSGGL